MNLTVIPGGKDSARRKVCTAQIGFANGKPVICNGKGYGYTTYTDVNKIVRRRVTVCVGCEGSGKA